MLGINLCTDNYTNKYNIMINLTYMKGKKERKQFAARLGIHECVLCGKVTDKKELDYNARFAMFGNKQICDPCADSLEK